MKYLPGKAWDQMQHWAVFVGAWEESATQAVFDGPAAKVDPGHEFAWSVFAGHTLLSTAPGSQRVQNFGSQRGVVEAS